MDELTRAEGLGHTFALGGVLCFSVSRPALHRPGVLGTLERASRNRRIDNRRHADHGLLEEGQVQQPGAAATRIWWKLARMAPNSLQFGSVQRSLWWCFECCLPFKDSKTFTSSLQISKKKEMPIGVLSEQLWKKSLESEK